MPDPNTNSVETLRAQILALLYPLLVDQGAVEWPVRVNARDADGKRVAFVFSRHELRYQRTIETSIPVSSLLPEVEPEEDLRWELKHRRLLAKAKELGPSKARKIISNTPYTYNTSTRTGLTDLVRHGYLSRDTANRYHVTPKGEAFLASS